MRFSTAKLMMMVGLGTFILLFPADGLRALGLGEARVNSYLGQPLDITIRLIEADADALDSLTARSATSDDYERLGVPIEALGLGLDVSVDRRSDPPLLHVTSRRPAHDPVLRFMIDARWASGRLLREYTVFLDPPTYDVAPPVTRREEAQRPADPPVEAEPAPRERPAPDRPVRPSEPTAIPAPESAPEPESVSGPQVVGPVAAGQTLWGIAYEWRPDTSLSMNQVMLAILERNPQAFRDNNVNRLLRGAELTMPEPEEVRALSAREADRRMQAQMQAWRDRAPERADVPVVAEEAVPEVESPREELAEAASEEAARDPEMVHRLEVVPPESDLFDEGPAVSDGEIQRATRRLTELENRMYAEGLENDELYRDMQSIREAIESRDAAGLAVADEEMALLESRLRQARTDRMESDQRVSEPVADDDGVSDYFRELEEEFAETDPVVADGQETGSRPDAAEEVVPEPDPAQTPVAAEPERTGLSWWLWLIVALVVVGLAAGVLFVLKRRASTDMQPAPVSGRRRADAVEAARKQVAADPTNLAAHLGLVKALADHDDNERFAQALDDMYRQVDNDDDPAWQDALNLAVTHAPDHPLLTPPEQRVEDDMDDDEGLDDRTREMLGILDSEQETRPAPDDYELGSDVEPDTEVGGEEFFATHDDDDLDLAEESDTRLMGGSEADEADSGDAAEELGEDMDLAELSNRLDDPALETREAEGAEETDDDELDIGELEVDDEPDSTEDIFAEDQPDDDAESAADQDSELELDFEFASEPEAAPEETDEPDAQESDSEAPEDIEPVAEFTRPQAEESDIDDLGLDIDDDLAIPEQDESVPDIDQPEAEESDADAEGDREIEAFLSGDSEDEPEAPESDDAGQDEGEPTLSDEDAEVKLDLARAYLSMDDPESARALLEEITDGGSGAMREQAAKLLADL